MLSWLPPILQPPWVDTVSKAASICHPHQVGSLSPSEQLTMVHFSRPPEDALEHWADPDWKPPIVTMHCYNASLAQVPAAALRTGDPMSSVSLHFPPHLTLPHARWGHKCCAKLLGPAGTSFFWPQSMWDPSFPTRDWIFIPCLASAESPPLDHQGSPPSWNSDSGHHYTQTGTLLPPWALPH